MTIAQKGGVPENPQAFPLPETDASHGHYGMTLRDWFAGQALLGLLEGCSSGAEGSFDVQAISYDAFRLADAMLAARQERAQ